MSSELGHESDQPSPAQESGRFEMTPERAQAYSERVMQAMDRAYEQEREKDLAAAEARGLTREQWSEYEGLRREDGWHAGRLEQARYRLREGPPDSYGHFQRTTDEEKREFWDKWRGQENSALERFRTEPVEGPENKPIDPERISPRVRWREGDPPFEPGDLARRDGVNYVREERRDWQDPRTGLRGPEASPDPRLSPEEEQGRIEERRGQAAEVMGARAWSNSKLAGSEYGKLSDELRERFPGGVRFTYEGFPDFDRYAIKTVVFDEGFRGPTRRDDFKRANAIFGWRKEPRGTTWHHCEDGVTMLLMDEKLHGEVGHWGGVRAAKQAGLWEKEPEK